MDIDESPPTVRHDVPTTSPGALLVMSPQGVFTFALPERGTLTIGRGAECELRLDDTKASRRHALLHAGPRCAIEDLGSMNGTRLGERQLEPNVATELRPGEMVTIGTTVILLHATAERAAPIRMWSQEAFEQRVDAELASAKPRGANVAVIRLGIDDGPEASASTSTRREMGTALQRGTRLEQTFRECLRPTDVVGSTAPGTYEILLPATGPDEAAGIAGALLEHLREQAIACAITLACAPRDGATRDALVRAAKPIDGEPASTSVALSTGAASVLSPMVLRIAAGEINVLLLGETGSGKEVTARAIHVASPRANAPLVCINCAALSESLLESELFGHEKGAFTGALQSKPGLLESADGGTVFLDEIGEMPLALQAKLLRVLEQREVLRVGALRPRTIDVRFLAATNRDLHAEIGRGRFRQDLYFRLNGVSLVVPPLRERLDEIAPLARTFVKQACERSRRSVVPRIAPSVLDVLRRYAWPGNVRELRNLMERAVLFTSGDEITMESFPAEMMSGPVIALRSATPVGATMPPASRGTLPPSTLDPIPSTSETSVLEPDGKLPTAEAQASIRAIGDERARIVAALEACGGNQTSAAKVLGVSRRTLVSRLGEYDLPRPRKK